MNGAAAADAHVSQQRSIGSSTEAGPRHARRLSKLRISKMESRGRASSTGEWRTVVVVVYAVYAISSLDTDPSLRHGLFSPSTAAPSIHRLAPTLVSDGACGFAGAGMLSVSAARQFV